MTRSEKKLFVQTFAQSFGEHSCMIVVRQSSLSASAVSLLRRNARSGGVTFQVVKNNLAKRIFQGEKTMAQEWFKGPLGVIFAQDPVAAAKVVEEFSKKREADFYPIGGFVDGTVITRAEIKQLSELPSLPQLRAQLLGVLNAPATKLLRTLKEPGASLVRVLDAYGKK